jgi:predicted metal-dependent phosphotriesterase family hydrolase
LSSGSNNAGLIGEIGVQGRPITDNEVKSIRASRLTGTPRTFHMGGGFAFMSNLVIPVLKALGVRDDANRKITVDNPRRVPAFVAPQPLVARQ